MSFSFLLGILACCISAFVTINRFGFALDGAWCAFDRIYYDALFGQLIKDGERWEGILNTRRILGHIKTFSSYTIDYSDIVPPVGISNDEETDIKNFNSYKKILMSYSDLFLTDEELNILDVTKFNDVQEQIYYENLNDKAYNLEILFKVLPMIYFCLLLIAVTAAGVSMMFYACLKRQGYLITFMHVLWNIIRFFIFSFFLYGMGYGIYFLILRDLIASVQKIFEVDLKDEFLRKCLFSNETKFLDESIKFSVKNIFLIIQKYKINTKIDNPSLIQQELQNFYQKVCSGETTKETACNYINQNVTEGIFVSFDCGFLKSNLHHLYRALEDASVESRILCALTLSAAFFGAIAVYFFLLVIHHYNNELFFDSGKSIFTGFDGFGRGFQKKNHSQDPAYKKRKLRAEIELTSKNEDENIEN